MPYRKSSGYNLPSVLHTWWEISPGGCGLTGPAFHPFITCSAPFANLAPIAMHHALYNRVSRPATPVGAVVGAVVVAYVLGIGTSYLA